MSFSGLKRPGEDFSGALVSAKKPRQDLVAVTGRENTKQVLLSVSTGYSSKTGE